MLINLSKSIIEDSKIEEKTEKEITRLISDKTLYKNFVIVSGLPAIPKQKAIDLISGCLLRRRGVLINPDLDI